MILLIGFTAFSQQKTSEHIVAKGETISKIAKQYSLKATDIYELNPEARNGIKFNSVLLIPITTQNELTAAKLVSASEITHEVMSKETLYGISKEYGVSVEDLYKTNPTLEESGLRVGQKLTIISSKLKKKNIVSKEPTIITENFDSQTKFTEGIEHEVLPKQTKYNIAKEHGITVAMLDMANPILKTEALKVGQKILIPVKNYIPEVVAEPKGEVSIKKEIVIAEKSNIKEVAVSSKPKTIEEVSKEIQTKEAEKGLPATELVTNGTNADKEIIHEVLPKETKFGITREYGLSVADLEKANPFLATEGLRIGQKISIPNQAVKEQTQQKTEGENKITVSKTEQVTSLPSEVSVEMETISHTVLPKETKWGIARAFGITVKELEKQNPEIVRQLKIGSSVTISKAKPTPVVVKQEVVAPIEESPFAKSVDNEAFVSQLISTASDNIGVRYRSGGTTKDGFDCSGLMCTTFGTFDIQLPRTSMEQSQYGTIVDVENAKKGDLIFFKTRGGRQINHVGMVVEVGDGDVKFIHAASNGVIISSIKESYYSKRLVQINRVL